MKTVIRQALQDAPGILHDRAPEVLLGEFASSSIVYRVASGSATLKPTSARRISSARSFTTRSNATTSPSRIRFRWRCRPKREAAPVSRTVAADTFAAVAMFSPLSDSERAALIAVAKPVRYAAASRSSARVRPASLFVVARGEASVTLAGTDGEVARLRNGDVFGEMSLLTGEPRTATVSAVDDCDLVEVDAEGFRTVVMANPSVLERVTTVTAARREDSSAPRNAYRGGVAHRNTPVAPRARP